MLTDLPDFESVNQLAFLPAGRYVVVESIYRSTVTPPRHAVLSEMLSVPENRKVAVDLQILTEDGQLCFRDFCLIASGMWRDSYGATAWGLEDLLPPELLSYALTERNGTLVDHDGDGILLRVGQKE